MSCSEYISRYICLMLLLSFLVGCIGMPQSTGVHKQRKASPKEIEWQVSFKEAAEVAREQNIPMMLIFYGVSSKRLDDRVFSAPDVIELAQKFVSLKVGAGQDDLIQKYRVQEFPTIVFADPQGGEYDRFIGYKSRQSFVEILKTALIPIEAEYSLQIDLSQPKLARVKCVFRNVRWKSLTLVLREGGGEISNISYDSDDGRPGWEEIEGNSWLMKFNTTAMKTATVEYEVGLNVISDMSYETEYVSYMGDDYGVFDGRALFLAPRDLNMIYKTDIHISLPPGWRAITPWEKNSPLSFTAGHIEEVLDSFFCIGEFQSVKRNLGEHEIFAVHCGSEDNSPDMEQRVDVVVQIFEDYIDRFGDFPSKKFLAVFSDPTPDGKYFRGSAHGVGFAGPVDVDYSFIAHEVFHVWNGDIINQESYYEGWFKEGFTQYYGYLTPYRVELYDKERFFRYLKRDYEGYLKRYGTKDDIALTNVREELARKEGYEQPESARLWIMYYKGALVASLMDSEIKKRTKNKKTLDDLMNYMFHEFRDRKYSSKDILEALKIVTGQDFSGFFSDFVYGKSKLPLVASGADESENIYHKNAEDLEK